MEINTLVKDTVADATPGAPGGLLGFQSTAMRRFPSPYPVTLAFTAAVPFTAGTADMGEKDVRVSAANIAFTLNATGSVNYGEVLVDIIADGSHNVTWAADFNLVGEQAFDNTSGQMNMVYMFRRGSRYYYTVTLGPLV